MNIIKIVYFGSSDISTYPLKALLNDERYQIIAVVTKPNKASGRGQLIKSTPVAEIANNHNLKLLQPIVPQDIIKDLTELKPDVGVLVSYGKIIPSAIIDLFPFGIINFHPSMLPLYRGPSPIETAIKNGDQSTGLTLMKLTAKMDAGDIYYQEEIGIDPDATTPELHKVFGQRGAELIVDNLDKIMSGQLTGTPQDESLASYCHLIAKSDGQLDPANMTGRECYNRLRAFAKWPKCRLNLSGKEIIITKAKPLDQFSGDSWPDVIPCAQRSALQIIEIISPSSGRRMSLTDYRNGLKNKS